MNFLIMFVPEKRTIKGIVFDLKKDTHDDWFEEKPFGESGISLHKKVEVTNYFITVETEDGDYKKIKTDFSHFLKLKKGEKFDFMVTQRPFSNELVLE